MFSCIKCLSLGGFYRRNLCVFMHKMSQSWWVLQKLRRRVRWVSSGNMAAVTTAFAVLLLIFGCFIQCMPERYCNSFCMYQWYTSGDF